MLFFNSVVLVLSLKLWASTLQSVCWLVLCGLIQATCYLLTKIGGIGKWTMLLILTLWDFQFFSSVRFLYLCSYLFYAYYFIKFSVFVFPPFWVLLWKVFIPWLFTLFIADIQGSNGYCCISVLCCIFSEVISFQSSFNLRNFKIYVFYFMCVSVLSPCMFVQQLLACSREIKRGHWILWNWSHRQFWDSIWVLGTNKSSSPLNHVSRPSFLFLNLALGIFHENS